MNDNQTDLQTLPPAIPPERPAAPPRRSNARLAAVAALVVTMLIAGVTGFLITSRARSGTDFASAVGGSTPATPPDRDAHALDDLNVQQSDVTAQYSVALIPDGDSLTSPTLDLCNATFPSEARRIVRRQVAAVDAVGTLGISTEAVLYRRPADAALAFTELRKLSRTCPNHPVPSPTGGRTLTTRFGPAPDRTWATVANIERIAFDVNTTDELGDRERTVAVYLRRGRVLMGVYFPTASGTQASVAGETTLEGISRVFASRIAELPASVVTG